MTTTSQSANGSAERQLALTNELLASGIPEKFHQKLSYRLVSAADARNLVGAAEPGWIVSYCHLNGSPMTHDGKPFHRLKKENGSPKYLTAKGAGCRPYFSPLLRSEQVRPGQRIRIVEGEKKADSLCANGRPAIALAGVDAWQDRRNGTGELLPELLDLGLIGSTVLIVYDSDVAVKEQVRRAITGLACCLTEEKAQPMVVLLPCELDGGKNGVDDFIARHGIEAYDELERIARPAEVKHQKGEARPGSITWKPEPKNSHHCAVTAAQVFKDTFANHPSHGLYQWKEQCWELIQEKPGAAIDQPLHKWMDHMGWENRACGHMTSFRSELLVRIRRQAWDPPHLVAFANGTLNTETSEFVVGHRKEDLLTQCYPFNYDPAATCPLWLAFLKETFDGNEAVIRLLRAAFHWSLKRKDPDKAFPWELVFEFVGLRGSGKGTIAEVLTAVCGGIKSVGRITSATFGKDTGLASLIGKRVAIEYDVSGHLGAAGLFNSVISNEPVTVKFLYRQEFATRLGIVIWRFYNSTPTASGEGLEGIGRRTVRFSIPKPAARQDTGLKAKLMKEVSGIFAWAWSMDDDDMADAFRTRGQIKVVREASIEGLLASMPWLLFLQEVYPDGVLNIKAQTLYDRYKEWTQDNGRQACSQQTFGENIAKLPWVHRTRKKYGNLYTVETYTDQELAATLGVSVAGVPVSGAPEGPIHPGGTPSNQLQRNASEEMVYEVYDSSQKLEKVSEIQNPFSEKEFHAKWYTSYTPCTPRPENHPSRVGSGFDVAIDDGDDPYWPPRQSDDMGNGRAQLRLNG